MRTTTIPSVHSAAEIRSKNLFYVHLSQMNIRWNLLNIRIKQPFV